MTDLMRPPDATAHLCGMRVAEPFVLHGVRTLDDVDLTRHGARYRALLSAADVAAGLRATA